LEPEDQAAQVVQVHKAVMEYLAAQVILVPNFLHMVDKQEVVEKRLIELAGEEVAF